MRFKMRSFGKGMAKESSLLKKTMKKHRIEYTPSVVERTTANLEGEVEINKLIEQVHA